VKYSKKSVQRQHIISYIQNDIRLFICVDIKSNLDCFRSRRYSGENRGGWACGNWFEFLLVVVVASILLLGALGLVIFWVFYYRGGVGWQDEPQLHFNLHPILMIGGFITLSGFCKYFIDFYPEIFNFLLNILSQK
jgi:hypothetical protein